MPLLIAGNFQELEDKIQSEPIFLVYYHDPGCAPCAAITPRLEQLMDDYPEIWWSKVNISSQNNIAGQHLIFSAPTIRVYYQGKEYTTEARFIDMHRIEKTLSSLTIQTEDKELIE